MVGQEATTFDDWLDEVIIITMTIDESNWKGALRLDSQHRWMRYLAQLYGTVLVLEDCTCSDHTGPIANTDPILQRPVTLVNLGPDTGLRLSTVQGKQKLHASPFRE